MIYVFGTALFIVGALIATQNTASKVSVPLMVVGLVLIISHAMAADNNPFSGARGIRVMMVRERASHKSKACLLRFDKPNCLPDRRAHHVRISR